MSYSSATPEHQKMVDSLAKFLQTKGLELLGVAHDDYPKKSWEIGGKVPDVIARDNSKDLWSVGDAKTTEDIDNDHTKDQLTAWGGQFMTGGPSQGVRIPIYLSVPRANEAVANAALGKWGLVGKVTVLVYGS